VEDNSLEQVSQTDGEKEVAKLVETPETVETETVETETVETETVETESVIEVKEVAETTEAVKTEKTTEAIENAKVGDVVEIIELPETSEEKVPEKTMSTEEKESITSELKSAQENGTLIDVVIASKARGGLRVDFKGMSLFLPISHFSLKKMKNDSELDEVIGKTLSVNVHDIKVEETNTSIIVTRKKILEEAIWSKLEKGQTVEGIVTSIPTFGVFLDIGGVEGLIHVSRLSKGRVENTRDFCKKGDKLEVKIISLDKENNKIGLSRRELEPSTWIGTEELFPKGSIQKAKVRRFTDFGTFVELKPGVDGLLRNGEISWTKRISHPSQKLKIGETIDVQIVSISESKGTASLSIKRAGENPWKDMAARFPIDSVYFAELMEISPKGLIFALNDDVDGFMPRSKLRPIMKGRDIPYSLGEKVEIMVTEVNAENESMILAPKLDPAITERFADDKKQVVKFKKTKDDGNFSLADLLNKSSLDSLSQIKD
jgi:small subunit ribosomal protein S1